MSSVDDRIVNMQFNSKQFTQGADQSKKSLMDLESAVQKTAQSKGLDSLGKNVENVTGRFSAMRIAGVTAIATIANKATVAGLNLLKSFTIQPVLDGLSEYKKNLESIQTIDANSDAGIPKIIKSLDELNAYSDATIYNFSEMAKNIGTFTAAGVKLKKSVSAIQGIANLAALSGSSSEQASSAMYQLSQALAAGRVNLQDWNSVVNAGMGGKTFQSALALTATRMGTLNAGAVKLDKALKVTSINGKSFRESIAGGSKTPPWLTDKVLTQTLANLDGRLVKAAQTAKGFSDQEAAANVERAKEALRKKKYTEEEIANMTKVARKAYMAATQIKTLPQLLTVVRESIGSTFSKTFQILLGDFKQSKKLWTSVGKTIGDNISYVSKRFNNMLQAFVNLKGRTKIIEGFGNAFEALGKIMGAIKEAFRGVSQNNPAHDMAHLAKQFAKVTEAMIPSKETLENITRTFAGLFAVLHIGFTIFKAVGALFTSFFGELFKGAGEAGGGLLEFTAKIGDLLVKIEKFVSSGGKLVAFFSNIGSSAGKLVGGGLEIGSNFIFGIVNGLVGGAAFGALFGAISGLATKMIDAIKSALGIHSPSTVTTEIGGNLMQGLVLGIQDGIGAIFTVLGAVIKAVFSGIGSLLKASGPGVSAGQAVVDAIIAGIKFAVPAIFKILGVLATEIFKVLGSLASNTGKATAAGKAVVDGIVAGINFAIPALFAIGGAIFGGIFAGLKGAISGGHITGLLTIFNAVLIVGIVKKLHEVIEPIKKFKEIFQEGVMKTLGTMQNTLRANAIKAIAVAIGILVAALIAMQFIDFNKAKLGIGVIASLMTMLVGVFTAMSFVGKKFATGAATFAASAGAMLVMANAVLILTGALTVLAHQKPEKLWVAIGMVTAILGVMVGAVYALAKIGPIAKSAALSLIVIATAINMLVGAITILGFMPWKKVAQGLTFMAIGLGLLVGAAFAMSVFGNQAQAGATAMLLMSGAMFVMATAVAILGKMKPGAIGKALGAFAIMLGVMVGTLLALSKQSVQVSLVATSILVLAGAMLAMATAIKILGSMKPGALKAGLIALAVGFGILIAAALLATTGPVTAGLTVLGGVMVALGAGLALAGLGMFLFATGFAIFAAAGVAGVAVMTTVFQAFMALIPTLAMQVAAGLVTFMETLAAAAPRLQAAATTLLNSFTQVLIDYIPKVGEVAKTLLTTILDVVLDTIPKIRDVLTALITAAIDVIENSAKRWATAGIHIIEHLLTELGNHTHDIVVAAGKIITDFLQGIADNVGPIADAGTNIVTEVLNGIGGNAAEIIKAAGDCILSILNAIDFAVVEYLPRFRNAGLRIAGHVVNGLAFGLPGKIAGAMAAAANKVGGNGRTAPGYKVFVSWGARLVNGMTAGIKNASKGALAEMFDLMLRLEAQGNGVLRRIAAKTIKAQRNADVAQARANITKKEAAEAERIADKKGATRRQKDKAKHLSSRADKQQTAADKAQTRADAKAKFLEDQQAIETAKKAGDYNTAGDIYSERGSELAKQAAKRLAKANAEVKRAGQLTGKARENLLKQAQKDAKAASDLAKASNDANDAALKNYSKGLQGRLDAADKEQKARAWQRDFDKADAKTQASMLDDRAEKEKEAAQKAFKAAKDAKADAIRLQKTDAKRAAAALDLYDQKIKEARDAQDAQKADEKQAKELRGQGSSGTSSTGGIIMPARTALEDAARSVDRYTASLAAAEEAAGATPTSNQYTQNIYAPVAPSASEIYRNSKNLFAITSK